MNLRVQLEHFEGPLALLLHLIRKEEMDIFNINIHEITRQYLEYIKLMRKLDLEIAGEFVAMASTLILVKSRMLLPTYNEDGEEVEQEDPRRELVQKLLEYQKFQTISQRLYQRPLVGRDLYLRGTREALVDDKDVEISMEEDDTLFALISAFRMVIRNMNKTVHKVGRTLQSISARILELREYLRIGHKIIFRDLIDAAEPDVEKRKGQVLITFLSLLELSKLGFISLFQTDIYSDIHIEPLRAIDRDVISNVEEFNYHNLNLQNFELGVVEHDGMDLTTNDENQILTESVEQHPIQGVLLEATTEDAATDDEILAEELKIADEEASKEVVS